jgi:predicted alpha/beta hydrolase family esterase
VHLAHRRPDLDIAAALLVAPADVDSARRTPRQTHGFAPIPRRPLPFRSIVVASTNDSYITIDRARGSADAWEADFVDAGPVGHINIASGFGPWSAGVRMVESLRAWAGARPAVSHRGLPAAVRAR